MEKFVKNDGEVESSEEMRQLFVDKDTLTNVVNGSHDVHLGKIDAKEDEIVTRATKATEDYIASMHQDEIDRNRSRVAEIRNLVDHLRNAFSHVV